MPDSSTRSGWPWWPRIWTPRTSSEPFHQFATSAENLCREREMLSGRSLDAGESALPVLGFLTDGQDRFFFDLHRFQSDRAGPCSRPASTPMPRN